jgi:hypothetical protein
MLIPHIHAPFRRLRTGNTHLNYRGEVRNISLVNTASKERFSTLLPPLISRQRGHCGRPLRPVLFGTAVSPLLLVRTDQE